MKPVPHTALGHACWSPGLSTLLIGPIQKHTNSRLAVGCDAGEEKGHNSINQISTFNIEKYKGMEGRQKVLLNTVCLGRPGLGFTNTSILNMQLGYNN